MAHRPRGMQPSAAAAMRTCRRQHTVVWHLHIFQYRRLFLCPQARHRLRQDILGCDEKIKHLVNLSTDIIGKASKHSNFEALPIFMTSLLCRLQILIKQFSCFLISYSWYGLNILAQRSFDLYRCHFLCQCERLPTKKKQLNVIRLYTLINLDILVEMTAKALKSSAILFFFAYFNNKRYLCFR